jgi:shikimate kinase
LVRILHRLWTYSLTTKSDEVRAYADEVAEAASRGFISTAIIPNGTLYGRLWKLTPSGTQFLFDHAAAVADEEDRYVQHHQS